MVFAKSERSRVEAVLERFQAVRKATEELCRPLAAEDFLLSAGEDTSPPKWHLAHTTWFFENFFLKKIDRSYGPYRPEFHFLFNSYYRAAGSFLEKSRRNALSRPSTTEIFEYRKAVTKLVLRKISELSLDKQAAALEALEVGIHHEQQHQELLLMDIKRSFYENPLRPKYHPDHSHGPFELREVEWHNLASGLYDIGVSKNASEFAYDNEKDRHPQWLESCMISSHLVTNEEYLAFIEEGGYDNPLLWHSDGWELKEREGWQAPLYWERDGQQWWVYTLGGMMPIDFEAPVVHVSWYEASAFTRWKGARLPTEFEWEAAAGLEASEDAFLEQGYFEPQPSQDTYELFSQIHGAVWEWTQSAYLPYPRYERMPQGLGEYNGKFMCSQFVLRGGACITPRSHYRLTYRNFYYPHMRWQYAGLRLAKDLA